MMCVLALSRWSAPIAVILLCLACGASEAQSSNPLIGAWSGTSSDGSTFGTDVYGTDGTLTSTARVSSGMGTMLIRVFARYQARQIGPNQFQIDTQVMGYLPQQICNITQGGTDCRPFPLPNLPTSMTATFLDQNTLQANGTVSHRDFSQGLGQVDVPAMAMVQVASAAPPIGIASTCSLGATMCNVSGWRQYCERWPDGHADWMQHGVRCRNGYGQREF